MAPPRDVILHVHTYAWQLIRPGLAARHPPPLTWQTEMRREHGDTGIRGAAQLTLPILFARRLLVFFRNCAVPRESRGQRKLDIRVLGQIAEWSTRPAASPLPRETNIPCTYHYHTCQNPGPSFPYYLRQAESPAGCDASAPHHTLGSRQGNQKNRQLAVSRSAGWWVR